MDVEAISSGRSTDIADFAFRLGHIRTRNLLTLRQNHHLYQYFFTEFGGSISNKAYEKAKHKNTKQRTKHIFLNMPF